MTVPVDLGAIAEKWLRQCPAHDAGLAMSCTCPQGDPRNVIANLVDEVRRLREDGFALAGLRHEIDHLESGLAKLGIDFCSPQDVELPTPVDAALAEIDRLRSAGLAKGDGAAEQWVSVADLLPWRSRDLPWTWEDEDRNTRTRQCLCCGRPGHYQQMLEAHIAAHGVEGLGVLVKGGGYVGDGHHRVVAAIRLGIDKLPVESESDAQDRWLRDHGNADWVWPEVRRPMNAAQILVMTVLDRDGYRCVRCGKPIEGERGRDWSVHHRQPRGMGGAKHRTAAHTPANLLSLCGSGTTGCHGEIERRRAEALEHGWLVSRYADPASVPVLVDHGSRWVLLDEEGRYLDAEGVPA